MGTAAPGPAELGRDPVLVVAGRKRVLDPSAYGRRGRWSRMQSSEHEADRERGEARERDADRAETGGPEHPDEQAEVAERADGAHAEQISDEANFRADPDPPATKAGADRDAERGRE